MRKSRQILFLVAWASLLAIGSACRADTFTHRQTKEVVHGYATSKTADSNTLVHTQEKGEIALKLAQWHRTTDRLGRKNKVIVLTIDDKIMLQIETEAVLEALARGPDEGPLFVLLEIDTP
ncbi:MAG: hypothetical protein ACYSTZ_07905, partial [Planctomycetota bacterium]